MKNSNEHPGTWLQLSWTTRWTLCRLALLGFWLFHYSSSQYSVTYPSCLHSLLLLFWVFVSSINQLQVTRGRDFLADTGRWQLRTSRSLPYSFGVSFHDPFHIFVEASLLIYITYMQLGILQTLRSLNPCYIQLRYQIYSAQEHNVSWSLNP